MFGAINDGGFARITFLLPPRALVDKFESLIFPMDHNLEVLEKQSRTLAAICDALQPKLLSGRYQCGGG